MITLIRDFTTTPLPIPKIFLVVYLLKLSSECLVSYDPHFPGNDGTNKYRGLLLKSFGQWQPEMHCLAPRAAFGSPVTCPWLARLSAVARLTRRLLLLHN